MPQRIATAREKAQRRLALVPDAGFEDLGNGRLRDTQTGVVWTQSDNGRDINWWEANDFCQGKGQRLPTMEELAAIHNRPGADTTYCGRAVCKVSR